MFTRPGNPRGAHHLTKRHEFQVRLLSFRQLRGHQLIVDFLRQRPGGPGCGGPGGPGGPGTCRLKPWATHHALDDLFGLNVWVSDFGSHEPGRFTYHKP